MNYVYKVVGDFECLDFEETLNKLSKKFQFMYVDSTLFLALRAWSEYEGSRELIDEVMQPEKSFYIEEMSQAKLEKQQPFIKEWGVNQSVKIEKERYESENQARLREAWMSMDRLEEELERIAKENERKEVSDGE